MYFRGQLPVRITVSLVKQGKFFMNDRTPRGLILLLRQIDGFMRDRGISIANAM